jgi:hypothetical protein
MRFYDVTMITKHAETLKLLSLGSSDKTDLDVLTRQDTASRHGIAGYGSELKQVIQSKSQGTLTHTAIRILCLSKVRSHWYHTLRRLNRMTYPLTRAKYVRRRTFHRNFRKIQAENCSAIPQIILTVFGCNQQPLNSAIYSPRPSATDHTERCAVREKNGIAQAPHHSHTCFSFKGDDKKYEGNGYYFLEAHIYGMKRKGSLRILSDEMSTDTACERLHMLAPSLHTYRSYTVVAESNDPPCTL